MGDVTQALEALQRGEPDAQEKLLSGVYEELRAMAKRKMEQEPKGHTLQPTILVHDAFLKLVPPGQDPQGQNLPGKPPPGEPPPGEPPPGEPPPGQDPQDQNPHFANRAHFYAAAGEAMRRLLVDHARRRRSQKRGGGAERVELHESEVAALAQPAPTDEMLAVDEALDKLREKDPECADLVNLRYFVGMTMEQAAGALGLSKREAERLWKDSRDWLRIEIDGARHMDKLRKEDPICADLVNLHHFVGMSMEEAAAKLGLSKGEAERLWTFYEAWLRRETEAARKPRA